MKNATPPTPAPPIEPAQRTKEILRQRARELARVPVAPPQVATLNVLGFKLGHERYAVEQSFVREVHPLKSITPLPCTPAFIPGIINVRGQIIPVIDIKRLCELPNAGITDLHSVIVISNDEAALGILADAVTEVRSAPMDSIQPSLPTLTGVRSHYLKGVISDQTVILDAAVLLSDTSLIVDEAEDRPST